MKKQLMVAMLLIGTVATMLFSQAPVGQPVFHNENTQLITDDGVQASPELTALVEQTREIYSQIFGGFVVWSNQQGPSIEIHAIESQNNQILNIEFKNEKISRTKTVLRSWKTVSARVLANFIFYLVAPLAGADKAISQESPELVDIMDVRDLIPRDINSFTMPYSVASKPNGNLIIGQSSIITETDNYGRLIDHYGRSLLAQNQYSFAYDVQVSPSGTVFSRPASGQDLYIFNSPQDIPRKSNFSLEQAGAFAVLTDGSYVIKDLASAKTILVERGRKTELNLTTSRDGQYFLLASGPDSTIWVYDFTAGEVRVYAKDGSLLDQTVPLLPDGTYSTVKQLLPYPDGSFLIWSHDGVRRFDRRGIPIWIADHSNHPEFTDVTYAFPATFDPTSGCLFYCKPTVKQIFRILDTSWCAQNNLKIEQFKPLMDSTRKLLANNNDTAALKIKADWYYSHGAMDIAGTLYGIISEQDIADTNSADMVRSIKIKQLLNSAELARARVLDTIKTIGPETARSGYQLAMQLFEQVLALDPNNEEARSARNSLNQSMKNAEHNSDTILPPPLEFSVVRFDPLFPALMASYQKQTIGSVKIVNPLSVSVNGLSIQVKINRFMDYPFEVSIPESLKPGESIEVPIRAPINQEALQVEEDLPIQVQLTLTWSAQGQQNSLQKTVLTSMYRRTALTWDNSGKLSSFITPNEETVNNFALRSLDLMDTQSPKQANLYRFSAKIQHAAAIIDALATYHIAYLEDPQSPLSKILGKTMAIDTVRFPRTTLFYKSGDCDDSSALLASLLEAAGIHTAIMTVPGHIFIAFDTEEPPENAWIFELAGSIMVKNSSIWIPIETTDLENFISAWGKASNLITVNQIKANLEFLPLLEQRTNFPAISLPNSPYAISLPTRQAFNEHLNADSAELTKRLSELAIGSLVQNLPKQGRSRITQLNQIGILHSRFGEITKAENFFNQAIKEDAKNLAAYINLGNLYLQSGKTDQSLAILKQAQIIRPESPLVNLLLAQTWLALGDTAKSQNYFAQLRLKSPELADRYAYLAPQSDPQTSVRAAKNGNNFKPSWTIEDK